ncbi:MAG: flagellar motor protein MotB [Bdellovibrionales bacterium]
MQKGRNRDFGHEEVDSEGSWAISYGDMITLLLAFFVLFFTVDPHKEKQKNLQSSLVMTLTKEAEKKALSPDESENVSAAENSQLNIGKDQGENIESKVLDEWGAEIHTVGQRIIVDFKTTSFFGIGQLNLSGSGKLTLKQFVNLYMPFAGNYILGIRAYTDSRPVTSVGRRYKDNLELSALRSISAMRFLQKEGIPLDRMRLGGYGELKATAESLAKKAQESGEEFDHLAFSRKIVLVIEPQERPEVEI